MAAERQVGDPLGWRDLPSRGRLELSVGVGALDDPPEASGLAHYCEHVIAAELELRGVSVQAVTGYEETVFTLEVGGLPLAAVAQRLASALAGPRLETALLSEERRAILAEVDSAGLDSEQQVLRLWLNAAFSSQPGAPLGTRVGVSSLNRRAVQRFLGDWYVAGNMILGGPHGARQEVQAGLGAAGVVPRGCAPRRVRRLPPGACQVVLAPGRARAKPRIAVGVAPLPNEDPGLADSAWRRVLGILPSRPLGAVLPVTLAGAQGVARGVTCSPGPSRGLVPVELFFAAVRQVADGADDVARVARGFADERRAVIAAVGVDLPARPFLRALGPGQRGADG